MAGSRLTNYLHFIWAMTEKEIKARYKHTVFGFLWVILNPVFQMFVIGFVFSFFVYIPVANYYLFLFSGLLPWQFFSLTLSKATPSFVYERSLLQKANFPREAIPLSIVLSNFVHFVVSLVLLIVFLGLSKSIVFPQALHGERFPSHRNPSSKVSRYQFFCSIAINTVVLCNSDRLQPCVDSFSVCDPLLLQSFVVYL